MLAEAITANRSEVVAALQRASAATGSDFNYLLNTAMRESSLKPQAQSNTSSAAGLFQFIEQTWLGLVKEHGAEYGLANYARAIHKGANGRYCADSAADRQAILALRKDAQTSAYMAGEFAQEQRAKLQSGLGRDVCGGELYAAHFLGTDAACHLIQLAQDSPSASAAKAFPQAASANRSVFYNADGSSKTVGDVYNWALGMQHGEAAVTASQPAARPAVPATYSGDGGSDARLANAEFEMLAPSWMLSSANGEATNASLPHSPFLMTPGVIDLLTSMAPTDPQVAKRSAAP